MKDKEIKMKLDRLNITSVLTDKELFDAFFRRLESKGVNIQRSYDEGLEWTVLSNANGGQEVSVITFCTDTDDKYWRIMGWVNGGFSDEIHIAHSGNNNARRGLFLYEATCPKESHNPEAVTFVLDGNVFTPLLKEHRHLKTEDYNRLISLRQIN